MSLAATLATIAALIALPPTLIALLALLTLAWTWGRFNSSRWWRSNLFLHFHELHLLDLLIMTVSLAGRLAGAIGLGRRRRRALSRAASSSPAAPRRKLTTRLTFTHTRVGVGVCRHRL